MYIDLYILNINYNIYCFVDWLLEVQLSFFQMTLFWDTFVGHILGHFFETLFCHFFLSATWSCHVVRPHFILGTFWHFFLHFFGTLFALLLGVRNLILPCDGAPPTRTVEPFVWIGFLGNDNPNHSLLSIHSLSANTEIECDMFSQLLPKNGSLGKNPNQIWHIGNKNLEINKSGL